MNYPDYFPEELKPPVETARVIAEQALRKAMLAAEKQWKSKVTLALDFIVVVFPVFAHQACEGVRQGRWTGERVRKDVDSFLRLIAIEAYDLGKVGSENRQNFNWRQNEFLEHVKIEIEKSDAWDGFLEELRAVSADQAQSLKDPHKAVNAEPDADEVKAELASGLEQITSQPAAVPGESAASPRPSTGAGRALQSALGTTTDATVESLAWRDIEIRFLSDLKFQAVVKGKVQEPQNYADVGFGDGRDGTPKAAWETLRNLAESSGVIHSTQTAEKWPKLEKRMQEIRKLLRAHFNLDSDPVPYIDDGYKAQFKITLSASYEH